MKSTKTARAEAIYLALSLIPKGRVITYGALAKLAGIPNGARQVGKILCELPEGSAIPWHRVINAQGKLSLPMDSDSYKLQRARLQSEGIEFTNEKISLRRFHF